MANHFAELLTSGFRETGPKSSGSRGLSPTIGIYRYRSGESAAIPVCLRGYGFPLKSVGSYAMRSNVSTSSGVLDSESPVTRSRRLRCVQDRIAASHERIEPVRLGLGLLEPLLLLGRELIVVACSILDGGDELPQAVRALKPARVAKQGAQLATFVVARADLPFV